MYLSRHLLLCVPSLSHICSLLFLHSPIRHRFQPLHGMSVVERPVWDTQLMKDKTKGQKRNVSHSKIKFLSIQKRRRKCLTYQHRNDNPHKPTLKDNSEILSEIPNDPSDSPECQDDPIEKELRKSLAFVVHDYYYRRCSSLFAND